MFSLGSVYFDQKGSPRKVPFFWLFYLAKTDGKTVLFDTGFRDVSDFEKWGVTPTFPDFTDLIKDLKTRGLLAEPDAVFLTHNHFDHAGNFDLFPEAKFIIAKDALFEGVRGKDHIAVDDEYTFGPFTMKVVGGHAPGSSVVYFHHGDKKYVLTGDECYFMANMTENRPSGAVADGQKNAAFIKDGFDRKLTPLTFHDPQIFSIYSKMTDYIAKII